MAGLPARSADGSELGPRSAGAGRLVLDAAMSSRQPLGVPALSRELAVNLVWVVAFRAMRAVIISSVQKYSE